jgi:vacuolar-type H+-ATPase subunit C/Vma6
MQKPERTLAKTQKMISFVIGGRLQELITTETDHFWIKNFQLLIHFFLDLNCQEK